MPRFVARPIVVEAHQYDGATLPPDFALAVKQHLSTGLVQVNTGDGPRPCKYGDWIVRGASGEFSVVKDAAFEMMFEEQQAPTKRAYTRREQPNG